MERFSTVERWIASGKLMLLWKDDQFGQKQLSLFGRTDLFHLRTERSGQVVLTNGNEKKQNRRNDALPSSTSLKLIWDRSNDKAGSKVWPTMTNGIEMLCSGTKNRQNDSTRSNESGTYSKTISYFLPLSTVPSGVKHRKLALSGAPSMLSSLVHVKL